LKLIIGYRGLWWVEELSNTEPGFLGRTHKDCFPVTQTLNLANLMLLE